MSSACAMSERTLIAGDVSWPLLRWPDWTHRRTHRSRSHRFGGIIQYKSSVVCSHFWAHVKLLVPTLAYFLSLNARHFSLLRSPFLAFRLLTSSSTTWSHCVCFFAPSFSFTVYRSLFTYSRSLCVMSLCLYIMMCSCIRSPYYVVIKMRCDWRTNGDRRRQEVR